MGFLIRSSIVLSVLLPLAALASGEVKETQAPPAAEAGQPGPGIPSLLDELRLDVSGLLYLFWSVDLDAANPDAPSPNGANRFDVSRALLNFETRLGRSILARVTPDISRVQGTDGNLDGSLALRLFFAYVRFDEVLPELSVIGGLQPNPLNAFDDAVWQYRVLGPSIWATLAGIPTSDLGVGVAGGHWGKRLEHHWLLANGEGFARGESLDRNAAKYKSGTGRITVSPFARNTWAERLRFSALSAYGIDERFAGEHVQRVRLMGLASWEHPLGTVAVGAGPTWDGQRIESPAGVDTTRGLLFTSFGFVNLPLDLRLLGRFDLFNPDPDGAGEGPGQRTRLIAGVAWRINPWVQLIADYQRFGFEHADRLPEHIVGDLLFLHTEARF